uniref:Uncharacterized protein n=1 Tax=Tetranychus urticae TaxID=32264 RepID=T1L2A9_TETUR
MARNHSIRFKMYDLIKLANP